MTKVFKVIVPRDNKSDALSAEIFFSGLSGIPMARPIAVEIFADHLEIGLYLRGEDPIVLDNAVNTLRGTWPQCEVIPIDESEDPIVHCLNEKSLMQNQYEVRLQEAPFIPLRTHSTREGRSSFDDYSRLADPMVTVLSAANSLKDGERLLIQIAVVPIENEWGRFWRGSTQDIQQRLKLSPPSLLRFATLLLSAAFVGVGTLLWLLVGLMLSATPYIIPGAVLTLIGLGLFVVFTKIPPPVEADIVIQKVRSPAFRCNFRIFAWSRLRDPKVILDNVVRTLGVYSFPSGNSFIAMPTNDDDPLDIHVDVPKWQIHMSALSTLYFGKKQKPILSCSELADIWHIPHQSAYIPKLHYTTSKRLHPNYRSFTDPSGVFIGQIASSVPPVDVYLPARALQGHIALIGGTQTGKTNMMGIIASHIIASDPNSSVVVIDPHGTLAEIVLTNIPPERAKDTIFVKVDTDDYSIGLNLIDQSRYPNTDMKVFDKHISDTVETMHQIWHDSWGARTEDYLRESMTTLLLANQMLYRESIWHRTCESILRVTDNYRQEFIQAIQQPMSTSAETMFNIVGEILAEVEILDAAKPPGSIVGVETWTAAVKEIERIREIVYRGVPYIKAQMNDLLASVSALREAAYTYYSDMESLISQAHDLSLIISKWQTDKFAVGYASRMVEIVGDTVIRRKEPIQFTLIDVPAILTSLRFQSMVLGLLPGNEFMHNRDWWYKNYVSMLKTAQAGFLREVITPVVTKMNTFVSIQVARHLFGQSKTTISIKEIIDERKILIVDSSVGGVGRTASNLISSTLINWIAAFIFSRQKDRKIGESRPSNVYIIIDEFQSISGADFATVLSELGKFGARLILGTQTLNNLEDKKRQTRIPVLENVRTVFSFRVSANDASTLCKEFNLGSGESSMNISEGDLVGLPDFHCIVRSPDENGKPSVVTVKTRPAPKGNLNIAASIVESSIKNYHRQSDQIASEIRSALFFHIEGETLLPDEFSADRPASLTSRRASGEIQGERHTGVRGDSLKARR